MFNLSLILLVLVIAVTFEYEFKCPESGEWRLRALGFKCSIISQYLCLFRYPEREYHETCDGLDYSSIGSKIIYEPYFNKAYCSYERYQPFPFSTDGSSKCVYQKSFCNEKGQYLFKKGSIRSDITCGCDLTRGYEFVNMPKHECYCIPSEEDCSCHKSPCNDLVDQCPKDADEITTKSMSTTMKENRFSDAINIFVHDNNGKIYRLQCFYVTSVLLAVMVIVFTLFVPLFEHLLGLSKDKYQLSVKDKNRFKKLIQDEITEKRYFVRIMIVGKHTGGKSTLLRRLLNKNKMSVRSTDGVDIVNKKCKINIADGKWNFDKDIYDDKIARIKRALISNKETKNTSGNLIESVWNKLTTKQSYSNAQDDLSQIEMDDSTNVPHDVSNEETDNIEVDRDVTKRETVTHIDLDTIIDHTESSSLFIPKDLISHLFTSNSAVNMSSNRYALCQLWDFAGQKEFDVTHQAFLTSTAVYLVVADMTNKCDVREYYDFWFDSIHCKRIVDNPVSELTEPPVLLVFTFKDNLRKEDFARRKEALDQQIINLRENQTSKYKHLHETFYVSNMTDTDKELEKLRNEISRTAKQMDIWGKAFPLRWILLEHLIEINKDEGKYFINFTDMITMAKHPDINILEKKDLIIFLRYQHNVGNIIFFEDIQDLIILKPQWLNDVFTCLVSNIIYSEICDSDDWKLLMRQGKISESLITKLFKSKLVYQSLRQKRIFQNTMEKLDILVKIKDDSQYYIMPSKLPSATLQDVSEKNNIRKHVCERTSWLCLKFDFIPPSFFHHLSAWFIRKYNHSKMDSDSRAFAIYRGICLFDIDSTGYVKILVTMSNNVIALQVVSFKTQQQKVRNTCSIIYNEVQQELETFKERYKVKISYKIHFKCSDGDHHIDTIEYDTLTSVKEYNCSYHETTHRSENIYSPWMKNEVKTIPRKA